MAFRVNDVASDTTPFAILGTGQTVVGGTAAPGSSTGTALAVIGIDASNSPLVVQNTNASGFSEIGFFDDAGSQRGGVGYANASNGGFPDKAYIFFDRDIYMGAQFSRTDISIANTTGYVGIGFSASTASTILEIASTDLGNGVAGPVITLGRNTNATNTGAGSLNFMSKAGTAGYVWQDNAGQLRINTAAPSNANDTAGTVIGTQSSSLASKNLIEPFTDNATALQTILDAPLYDFTYKSGAYNNQAFTGIITDYSPVFGMDKDALHPFGKSLNTITAIGYTFGAIKELHQNLTEQKSQSDLALADLNLKTAESVSTLAELQASVNGELTLVGSKLNAQQVKGVEQDATNAAQDASIATLTNNYQLLTANSQQLAAHYTNLALDVNTVASKTTLLETQMQTLADQVTSLSEFYSTFDLGKLIARDASGNLDLTVDAQGLPVLLGGKLKATLLETGGIAITVTDLLAPTIGTAVITPVVTDANADGIDDVTGSDGKSVEVDTNAMIPMVKGSRIFTTFRDNPGGTSWVEKRRDSNGDFIGFRIRVSAPVTDPTKVDWLLVEQK
jgi:hypothetical protein